MTQTQTSLIQSVRAALLSQGMTMADWARFHGYQPKTLHQVLWRYSGSGNRPIRGKTLSIIEALEAETGIKICG